MRTRNLKLVIEFDGSRYNGWQRQKNGPSVQETIEGAIFKVTGAKNTVQGCSRTDSGVHAVEYVANFRSDSKIELNQWPHAINFYLPDDIAVLKVVSVDKDFNSQKSAIGKLYKYFIYNSYIASPLRRNYFWHVRSPLDTRAMARASQSFLGLHDFSSYCAEPKRYKNSYRFIGSSELGADGDKICYEIYANGFLYNMVRRIVGTLVNVGKGKISLAEIQTSFRSGVTDITGQTAPPNGLFLWKVYYQ